MGLLFDSGETECSMMQRCASCVASGLGGASTGSKSGWVSSPC